MYDAELKTIMSEILEPVARELVEKILAEKGL